MDFTRQKYRQLVQALQQSGLPFTLRHDVDKRPYHSLALAQIEAELGVKAVYYFRCLPCSNNSDVIRQIVALGHEIGYHYEDMSLCKGDHQAAMQHFEQWLTYFRQFYPVHRICMHGAPTSQYDGKDLWKHYNYRDYGVDYEPYFDEDYTTTFYLTDTGRCWDGYRVSVRDKVAQQEEWNSRGLTFHSTDDIIRWLTNSPLQRFAGSSLSSVLITTHPQRWCSSPVEWCQELCTQSIKNIIKRIIIWVKKS
ncbi:MAG: hypothetical protein MJZ48_01730 [Paludibacteraceae bacterium]|nr:hypothetical protein [Paludibacteraceae bacterium]